MLNIFLGRRPLPNYRLVQPANGELQKIIVKEDVSQASKHRFEGENVHLIIQPRLRKLDPSFPVPSCAM